MELTLIDFGIVALLGLGFFATYVHGAQVGFKRGFKDALDCVNETNRLEWLKELRGEES